MIVIPHSQQIQMEFCIYVKILNVTKMKSHLQCLDISKNYDWYIALKALKDNIFRTRAR